MRVKYVSSPIIKQQFEQVWSWLENHAFLKYLPPVLMFFFRITGGQLAKKDEEEAKEEKPKDKKDFR